jgi:CHASE3 domain sensor protein
MRVVEKTLLGGLVLLVFLLAICGGLIFRFSEESNADRDALNHTFQVIRAAQTLFAQIQAGRDRPARYILTQRDDYLAPSTIAPSWESL